MVVGLASGFGAAAVGPVLIELVPRTIKTAPAALSKLAEAPMGPTGKKRCWLRPRPVHEDEAPPSARLYRGTNRRHPGRPPGWAAMATPTGPGTRRKVGRAAGQKSGRVVRTTTPSFGPPVWAFDADNCLPARPEQQLAPAGFERQDSTGQRHDEADEPDYTRAGGQDPCGPGGKGMKAAGARRVRDGMAVSLPVDLPPPPGPRGAQALSHGVCGV